MPMVQEAFPLQTFSPATVKEDIPWFDCLNLPSLHDPEIDLYKEWHHFALFAPEDGALAMANACLLGNPYDASRGTLASTILVHSGGRWHGEVESRGVEVLRASNRGPHLAGRGVRVSYDGDVYRIRMKSDMGDSEVSADLRPLALHQGGFFTMKGRGHLGWVFFPRLSASGFFRGGPKRISLRNSLAFHDHNWGRFRWGDPLSWDWGVFLETSGRHPRSLLYYRLYQPEGNEETDMSLFVYAGPNLHDRVFSPRLRVGTHGIYDGRTWKLPGVLAMLHPRTLAEIPRNIKIKADSVLGPINVDFTPEDAALLIVPNRLAPGESVLCQCPGRIRVTPAWSGGSGHFVGYMEFARPIL